MWHILDIGIRYSILSLNLLFIEYQIKIGQIMKPQIFSHLEHTLWKKNNYTDYLKQFKKIRKMKFYEYSIHEGSMNSFLIYTCSLILCIYLVLF
jgi:hypothetical protein